VKKEDVSIKEVKLQIAEAKRNIVNILSTRVFACCKTNTNKTANDKQLASGIIDHKFKEFPSFLLKRL